MKGNKMTNESSSECKSKDSSTCRYHSLQRQAAKAVAERDISAYLNIQDQLRSASRDRADWTDAERAAHDSLVVRIGSVLPESRLPFVNKRELWQEGVKRLIEAYSSDVDCVVTFEPTERGFKIRAVWTPNTPMGNLDFQGERFYDYWDIDKHPSQLNEMDVCDIQEDFSIRIADMNEEYFDGELAEQGLWESIGGCLQFDDGDGLRFVTSEETEQLRESLEFEHVLVSRPLSSASVAEDYAEWYGRYRR